MSGHIEGIAHFFVCCFSQNGDELGQWRAYADDGRDLAFVLMEKLSRTFSHDRRDNPTPITRHFPLLTTTLNY